MSAKSFDIFISYARVDNLTGTAEESGWVDQFHENLTVSLAKQLGRIEKFNIWWDKNLRKEEVFDDVIENAITSSKIFIALLSKGYQLSEYCNKEMQTFIDAANQSTTGLVVNNRSRFLNVVLQDIDHTEWPASIQQIGTTGFKFIAPEGGVDPLTPREEGYKKEMNHLVKAIDGLLEEMDESPAPAPPAPVAAPIPRKYPYTVFLGAVPESLGIIQQRVKSDLNFRGVETITEPQKSAEDQDAYKAWLEKVAGDVDLCIHLLDSEPGPGINGDGSPLAEFQIRTAMPHAKSQMIWMPQDLNLDAIEDEQHRAFIHLLEQKELGYDSYDFILGRRNSDAVKHLITPLIERIPHEPAVEDEDCPSLLATQAIDTSFLIEVAGVLIEKKGIKPLINQEFSDKLHEIELFKERVREVKNLVVIFGHVTADWVESRVEEAVKARALKGDFGLNVIVFAAPPAPPIQEIKALFASKLKSVNIELIDNTKALNPEAILPAISC